MSLTFAAGDVIAAVALVFSVYATITTARFNGRQKRLIESQERLNLLLLDREEEGAISERRADLGASFVKVGSSSYRLKIWNRGQCTARNVRIEFPDGNEIASRHDIEQKFPLEALERHQAVELRAIVHMTTKSKHVVKLLWQDLHSDANEKVVYPTL